MQDIVHKVAAVGSRSVEKAQEFIDKVAGGDKAIKAYGNYEEVYADKVHLKYSPKCLVHTNVSTQDVDAIYIGISFRLPLKATL